ncbi:hypothetical protein [uncultured Novosphingobium sp.]|uniref:hypothetical protein n=1 Tax=uncultured Novosphingobium sp. TaxID=292277 RepID=UPI00374A4974
MAFDEGLDVYSRKGKVQAYGDVADFTSRLLDKVGELSGPEMDAAIRKEYRDELAVKLIGKEPFSRFDEEPYAWNENEEPKLLDIGFFLYASEIDWEDGVLKADSIPGVGELNEMFFSNSEFLDTELERPDFEAHIEGLSFEFDKIEMLLPSMELGQTIGFTAAQHDRRKPVGRPRKWDWEGAMASVISQAQHPDGLPTGPGAQARIEALISDWFVQQVQEAPSPSQVRQRAAKIIQMIETPKIR